MRKKIILLFILAIFGTVGVLYCLLNEKNYNSILMEHVSGRVTTGCDTFEEKVESLRNFVHENVHPVSGEENRLDTVGIDKLISGVGWCDQQARVFMQLAKKQGITTRLLFLKSENGSSPHSIAEAKYKDRWVIVDPAYNLEFYNKDGEMASMDDIGEDFNIVLDNPKVKLWAANNPWWGNEANLTMYYRAPRYVNTKKASRFRVSDYLPGFLNGAFVHVAQEAYIFKNRNNFTGKNTLLYFRARNYHLAGRRKSAEALYAAILKNENHSSLRDKVRFFAALLLKESGRANEAAKALKDFTETRENSDWVLYAHGLRYKIYENMEKTEEAEGDFARIAGSPDAVF